MRKVVSHYTTDTGELAPYPDMTADDLREFEVWAGIIRPGAAGGRDFFTAAVFAIVAAVAISATVWS